MALTSFDSLKSGHSVSGVVHRTSGLQDLAVDIAADGQAPKSTTWAFGSSGADTVNQVLRFIFTATKNTTTSLDLSGVTTNVTGETAVTLTKVKFMKLEYLTTSQDSTNGTASTGNVSISPGAANPITTSPLGTAEVYVMKPGDVWIMEKHDTGGFTVTGGSADTFDFLHSDTSADAAIRVTIYGNS